MVIKHRIALWLLVAAITMSCMAVEQLVINLEPAKVPTKKENAESTIEPTLISGGETEISPTSVHSDLVNCSDNACIQACLERLERVLKTKTAQSLEGIYADSDSMFSLVVYQVEKDEIVNPDILWVPSEYRPYQEDMVTQRRIWHFFAHIIPTDQRTMISQFAVMTDGKDGKVGAWVNRSTNDPEKWILAADVLDTEESYYLAEAMVHEFGHLLTLNASQVPINDLYFYNGKQGTPTCPQFALYWGCSLPESYINYFYQRFWKNLYEEWWEIDQQYGQDDYENLLHRFYQKYQDQFITEYAATNVNEDIAESWTYFVLLAKPLGGDTADQKRLFFYDFPELVELRSKIVDGICSYLRK